MAKLPKYPIPEELEETLDYFLEKKCSPIIINERYLEILHRLDYGGKIDFTQKQFKEFMSISLHIEFYDYKYKLLEFNCDVSIFTTSDYRARLIQRRYLNQKIEKKIYTVNFKKTFKEPPACSEGERIKIFNINEEDKSYTLCIEEVNAKFVIVSTDPSSFDHDVNASYRIEFIPNTYPFDCSQHALETITPKNLALRLFPSGVTLPPPKENIPGGQLQRVKNFQYFNADISKNDEQMRAVTNIFNKSSFPYPFVLFGPPGTGKTSTIVEAILQILKYSKNLQQEHKILVTAHSNSSVDTLTKILVRNKVGDKLIRLYSSFKKHRLIIDPEIKQYSHILEKPNVLASLINKSSIVTCSLCFSTRLILQQLGDKFSYIFIDEVSQASEPSTLIPFNINPNVHVILSGDKWQLGPVVKTRLAEPILGFSMLERLMSRDIYKKNIDSDKYDCRYIIKLLNNYRNDRNIIAPSNELFYENELRYCKPNSEITAKEFRYPIIFHANNNGKEMKEDSSTSCFNEAEISIVINYIRKLTNICSIKTKNIGIITPFKLQSEKIKQRLIFEKINGIEVGTVEFFQGREKDCIIISTVRSKTFINDGIEHLGHLSNPKRFNVAVTRAKNVLIIIGSPKILRVDKNWRKIIEITKKNNSYIVQISEMRINKENK